MSKLLARKNARCLIPVILVLTVALCTSCGNSPTSKDSKQARLEALLRRLRECDRVELYEGLPHPFNREAAFKSELSKVKPLIIRHQHFYDEAIVLAKQDQDDLISVLANEVSIPKAPKGCIFHADWDVRVTTGEDTNDWLVCFGCEEVDLLEADHITLDLDKAAVAELIELTDKYRRHRPTLIEQ